MVLGSLPDYLTSSLTWGLATKPSLLIVVGLVFGAIYFSVFYFAIKAFDIKTPGRDEDVSSTSGRNSSNGELAGVAKEYLAALGGQENLSQIDACITRLRLSVNDMANVDERALKALGASGVVRLNANNIQVVLGPQAEIIAGEMKEIVKA